MKDKNYINRIIHGDKAAFEEMYTAFKPQFLALLQKNQNVPRPDAEDLYHKACIILYNNIETGRLKENSLNNNQLKTYLNNTGKYVLFNQRRKRQIPLYSDSDQLTENSNVDDEPYDKEYDDKLFVVRTAVRDMPEPCSKLLNLVVYQKKSHHEVAQIMNYANEDTVKAQRWRCMKKLKEVVATRLKIAGYEE